MKKEEAKSNVTKIVGVYTNEHKKKISEIIEVLGTQNNQNKREVFANKSFDN